MSLETIEFMEGSEVFMSFDLKLASFINNLLNQILRAACRFMFALLRQLVIRTKVSS